ncbi:hypothetical protein CB1_000159020 [Camelus ferus]|nr:hypothetical protein CB1_000159020 [Camelus ferus]
MTLLGFRGPGILPNGLVPRESVCIRARHPGQRGEDVGSSDFGTSYTKLTLQPGVTTVIDNFYICPTNKRKVEDADMGLPSWFSTAPLLSVPFKHPAEAPVWSSPSVFLALQTPAAVDSCQCPGPLSISSAAPYLRLVHPSGLLTISPALPDLASLSLQGAALPGPPDLLLFFV